MQLPNSDYRQDRNRLSIGQSNNNMNRSVVSNLSPLVRSSISPDRPHYEEKTESYLRMMSHKNDN